MVSPLKDFINAQGVESLAYAMLLSEETLAAQKEILFKDTPEEISYKLSSLSLNKKEKLIEALLAAITFDQHLNRQEFEVFRVICDALEVPAPPVKI